MEYANMKGFLNIFNMLAAAIKFKCETMQREQMEQILLFISYLLFMSLYVCCCFSFFSATTWLHNVNYIQFELIEKNTTHTHIYTYIYTENVEIVKMNALKM